mgnify:CR=1 FL=1
MNDMTILLIIMALITPVLISFIYFVFCKISKLENDIFYLQIRLMDKDIEDNINLKMRLMCEDIGDNKDEH